MKTTKPKIASRVSEPEEMLAVHLRAFGLGFEREYRFAFKHLGSPEKGIREKLAAAKLRDWRFDFVLTGHRIAVEVEGGIFNNGRHVRPAGFQADCEKYNNAALLGWRVLRFTSDQVRNGTAASFILKTVRGVEWSER